MKDKNIYDLLNDGKFKEPEKIEEVSYEEIDKYKAAFLKSVGKSEKKKNILPKLAIAAALLIGFFSLTPPGQMVYAKIVEFYENMVNPISEYAIDSEATEAAVTRLDKEILSNGIKFTLKDVMADGDTLYLNMYYEVVDENILKEFGKDKIVASIGENDELLLNGEKVNWKEKGTVKGTIVDEKTNQQYYKIQFLKELKEGDVVTFGQKSMHVVEITPEDFFKQDGKTMDISGDWTVKIPITIQKEKLNTVEKTLNKEIYKVEGNPIIFESIRLNSFRSTIKLSYKDNARELGSKMIFIATDENGVEYTFDRGSSYMEEKELNYFGEDGKNISKAKTLTFQGYIIEYKEGKVYTPYGDSFVVNLK